MHLWSFWILVCFLFDFRHVRLSEYHIFGFSDVLDKLFKAFQSEHYFISNKQGMNIDAVGVMPKNLRNVSLTKNKILIHILTCNYAKNSPFIFLVVADSFTYMLCF